MQNKINFYFIFICLAFSQIYFPTHAQTFNTDCSTSKLICGNSNFTDNSNGFGFNDFSISANNRGCIMENEHQSAWYSFRIQTAGTLTFVITPNNLTNDYDFAVWGPDVICGALGVPIRCNFAETPGETGLSATATTTTQDAMGINFVRGLNVMAGEVYYLLVDNYSNNNQGFAVVWGGTASLSAVNASFSKPTIACNKAAFVNTSATCEATGTLTYLWDFGDDSPITVNNTAINPTHVYALKGTYTVTLKTTLQSSNPNNNTSTSIYKLPVTTLSSTVDASFPAPIITCNKATFANASTTCEVGTLTYLWNFGDGSPITANNTAQNPTHEYALKGTYTVTLTTKLQSTNSNNGTTAVSTMPITITNVPPIIKLNNLTSQFCSDTPTLTLQATPSGGVFTINGVAATVFNPTLFAIGEEVIVKYAYTDAFGCSSSLTQKVKILFSSGFATITKYIETCPNQASGTELEALTTAEESNLTAIYGAVHYEWSNQAVTRTIKIATEAEAGIYKINVFNVAGCPLREITYTVLIDCDVKFAIPSAFTPNNDGRNDRLEVFGKDFTNLDLRIYNRWGELVYIANRRQDAWDGTVAGKQAPEGVYLWTVRYENPLKRNVVKQMQGKVVLIR